MRQDHRPADDQPADRADGRPGAHRWTRRPRDRARAAAARDRLRDPAGRPAAASDDRGECGDGAAPARLGPRPDRDAGARAPAPGRARSRRVLRPLPGAAVGRPAAAGGPGARARRGPAPDADGRAVLGGRPHHPPAAAERLPAPSPGGSQDRRDGQPRHRRGGADGRPHRRDARGAAGAVRRASRVAGATRRRFRLEPPRRRPRSQGSRPDATGGDRHRARPGGARR